MGAVSFKVKQSILKTGSQEFRQYRNTLRSIYTSVEQTRRVMNGMHGSITLVCGSLSKIENKIYRCSENSGSMASALSDIAELYGNTEKTLTDSIMKNMGAQSGDSYGESADGNTEKGILEQIWGWICSLFGWGDDSDGVGYEIDSVVFDDTGEYGGDQGSPASQWGFWSEKEELYDIVREHFPDMSDKEIRSYLKKLNSEGCSYVATINTIFAAYEGREAEFERTFGFPMYKDGDLNYNELIVDFYCETDNHNKDSFGADYMDSAEDISSEEGYGATWSQQVYRAEMYLQERGVDVDISHKEITVDNFREYSENGYIVIDYFDGPLENKDGNTAQFIKGGHAMTITGVMEDGRYIVSSWGEKYYVDPSQGNCNYVYYEYH